MRTAMPGARKRTASDTQPASRDCLSHAISTSVLLTAATTSTLSLGHHVKRAMHHQHDEGRASL